MAVELWISTAAILISGGSAAVAGLSYHQTNRFRDDSYLAEVAAFQVAIQRKTVLKALSHGWHVRAVHNSIRELRDDLANRIGKLPKEVIPTGAAIVEACSLVLAELRPWTLNDNDARTEIDAIPEAVASMTK